jgi:hypothetical protein
MLALALLALAAGPVRAQYVAGDVLVTQGTPVAARLPADAADTLLVTYRAGSDLLAETDTLTATGGAVTWTPRQAGVVALTVPSEGAATQNVSVRFRSTPASGIGVLLAAGFILFGGAAFAFRKLFEGD